MYIQAFSLTMDLTGYIAFMYNLWQKYFKPSVRLCCNNISLIKQAFIDNCQQIQGGKPRLIGYASKTLPEACSRYSVTELEVTGLFVNMNLWKNLLKHREFDAAVDHAAVAQIMKAKMEPATTRIMRSLDRLSAHSFNLHYVKGRDMILSDYLSRHRQKDLDPSEYDPNQLLLFESFQKLHC